MQISPEQGHFMGLLMKILHAKKTLDIGTFTGYSALAVALALPKDGKVVAFDLNEEWTTTAREYWQKAGIAEKIDLKLGPAQESLQQLIDQGQSGSFDFAFIDADKANYDTYYEQSLQLVRPGGIIAIDNVLWDGKVADPAIHDESTLAIRNLNTKLLNDKRVIISMLPVGDGLTLALRQ
jgi:caffeoyl-CoA O-methyltransferase